MTIKSVYRAFGLDHEPVVGPIWRARPCSFRARRSDAEDGSLTGSIDWSSNLDGSLGTGGSVSTSSLSVGTHTVTASVTDSDGNTETDTTIVTIEPNSVPTVSITSGGGTYLAGATVQLQGTASDAEDGSLTGSIDWSSNLDGSLGTGGSVSTSSLSVGTHTITASVTDSDGNTETDTTAVTIQPNSVPTVSITSGGGTYLESQTVQLQGTASDAEDGSLTGSIDWSSNVDGPLGTGGSISTSSLSVDTHTITASVTDSDGNTTTDTTVVTIEPDTAPTVSITAGGGTYLAGATVRLRGTASDAEDGSLTASIDWSSNRDGPIGTGGSVNTSSLSVGTHTVTASVTDSDGNTETDTTVVTIEPNTVPTVSITAGGGTYLEGRTVQLQGTASDAEDGSLTASIDWSSNLDGPIGTGGSVSTTTLSVGTHTVTASVTDSDDNTSEATTTVRDLIRHGAFDCDHRRGRELSRGQTVRLRGTASDEEDGNLSASIAWSSNLDGPIRHGRLGQHHDVERRYAYRDGIGNGL